MNNRFLINSLCFSFFIFFIKSWMLDRKLHSKSSSQYLHFLILKPFPHHCIIIFHKIKLFSLAPWVLYNARKVQLHFLNFSYRAYNFLFSYIFFFLKKVWIASMGKKTQINEIMTKQLLSFKCRKWKTKM